jgi:hypothetical protein
MLGSAGLRSITAALLAVGGITASATALIAPAEAASGLSVLVHGRLLVVPAEAPGGHPGYGVALADGDIVPVRGSFDPEIRTGALFTGRLAIPAGVLRALSSRGETGATAALRIVDRRSLSLPVLGTPSIIDAPEASAAVTPTTHQQFVAIPSCSGT